MPYYPVEDFFVVLDFSVKLFVFSGDGGRDGVFSGEGALFFDSFLFFLSGEYGVAKL